MQLRHNAHGHCARRPYARALFCGFAAALALGASSAQAADEFRTGFEVHLGRALALNFAHVVLDIHNPHHVRYVPEFYADDHRVHRSRGHRYERRHYRAHRARHIHHVGCEHWTPHHGGHRDRYVHYEERFDHGRDRHRLDHHRRGGRHS